MKKSFLLIMCLLLAIAVVACNKNDNKTDDTTAADTTTAAVETPSESESSEITTNAATGGETTAEVEETSNSDTTGADATTSEDTSVEGTTELMTQHTHTFSADWSANDEGHWHAATCEHVGEIADKAAHADADEDGECDVCEYDLTCDHELSDEIVGIAAGHYHIPDCNHDDLILDLTAHVDANSDNVCDACEYSFDELIDDITSAEAASRVNGGTITYNGQYEKKDVTYNLGFGFLYMDENVEYSYDPGVIENNKHSVHAFNNGNVFYVKEYSGMVSREDYMITTDNVKGYKFSSDMFFYVSLDDADPCGVEDLLYAFYNFAKTNHANTLSITWGETNIISFVIADEYSAKVFTIDFVVSANGVITSLNVTSKQYLEYISAEQMANGGVILDENGSPVVDDNGNPVTPDYTIDENGVVTFFDNATVNTEVVVKVMQTEGSREDIKTTYDLNAILLNSYDIMNGEAVLGDTLNATVGDNLLLPFANVNPTTADFDLDRITALVYDEEGEETFDVSVYASNEGLSFIAYKAGNYVLKMTSLNTSKTIKIVTTKPTTTEIYAAVDNYGMKESFTEKTVYVNSKFEFVGLAQNTYADATFTATLPDGTTGAALTVLDTADGYSFEATAVGTYVVTLTSKANPEVTNTVTFNVIESVDVSGIFKGTWENSTYGISVEINPTDATSGTYTITMNNAPAQYTYTLSGTTIDAMPLAGVDQGWTLQFSSELSLEIASPYGNAFPLTQISGGDVGGDTEGGFSGTYTGDLDVMGMPMPAKVVVSGETFTFELDGTTTTYYFSIDASTGYLTTVVGGGNPPAQFTFRYLADMNILTVEMVHPMTGMATEIGALAQASGSDVVPANKMDGKYKGTLNMGVELVIEIEVDSMFETMTTVVDGISTTYAYSIGEDGILTTICVGGEQIGDFQFQYVAADDVIVVNSFNPRLGYYAYAGDAAKVTEEEPAGFSVEGMWESADGRYTFTFWEADGDGTLDFSDENGEWLKTIGFYFTMDDAGNITFTSIKGNLAGYMDWSTSSTAKVTEEGIILVLDTGVEVLLTPKAW